MLSIVVPCHNERAGLGPLLERLVPVLDGLVVASVHADADADADSPNRSGMQSWEIVLVDDGSRDDTRAVMQVLAAQDYGSHGGRVRVVALSRNFGKEAALAAGLDAAQGDGVIPMDADLQDPPEVIPELVAKWREGWPVVQAVRRRRDGDTWLKRTTARAFYAVLGKLSSTPIEPDAGDFQLLSRPVVEAIRQYPERTRFFKGLAAHVGFARTVVLYDRPCRTHGHSAWGYWKLWNLAIEGITGLSTLPLRVWTYIGAAVACSAFAWAAFIVTRTLLFGVVTPGYASMLAAILFLGGVQLIGLGVIGEYVGRISIEARQRPLYHVEQVWPPLPAAVPNLTHSPRPHSSRLLHPTPETTQ